jgi:hypothetical protein
VRVTSGMLAGSRHASISFKAAAAHQVIWDEDGFGAPTNLDLSQAISYSGEASSSEA